MSESARCLACTFNPLTRDHQCVGYTFPHATYQCGCVCRKALRHEFSHEDGFQDHCACGWSGTSHYDHEQEVAR